MTERRSESDGQGSFAEAVVAQTRAQVERDRGRRADDFAARALAWVVREFPDRDDHSLLVSSALMLRAMGDRVTAGSVLARREAVEAQRWGRSPTIGEGQEATVA